MNEENNLNAEAKEPNVSDLHKVTPLSKYLAMALFVLLPFVGGWVGYTYAPEKVVEVENMVEVEKAGNRDTQSKEPDPSSLSPFDELTIYDYSGRFFSDIPSGYDADTASTSGDLLLYRSNISNTNTTTYYIVEALTPVANDSFGARNFVDKEGVLYSLTDAAMGTGNLLVIRDDIDLGSFEFIDSIYAKDKNYVYFLDNSSYIGNPEDGQKPLLLNPVKATTTITAFEGYNYHGFITDGQYLYHDGTLLEGINPQTMKVNNVTWDKKYVKDDVIQVISDEDTVWLHKKWCTFNYEKSSFEEIEKVWTPC